MSTFWENTKRILRKFLFLIIAIVVVGVTGYFLTVRYYTYSDGSSVGKIIKFSHKGWVVKTHEGQLNLGGFKSESDGDIAANVWSFSVYPGSDHIQDQIREAMRQGQTVELHYEEKIGTIFFWGDTKYFIDDVDVVRD